MHIAISQINFVVGDLPGNAAKIQSHALRAKAAGAALLLTSELGLCGYPPEDLVLRDGFISGCDKVLNELARACSGIAVLVGHPVLVEGKRFNAVSLLRDARVTATGYKMRLPNDSVFDEQRYFEPGAAPLVFDLEGVRFGVPICQDIWEEGPAQAACALGAQVLLVPNGSPYHMDKQSTRYEVVAAAVAKVHAPILYCNQVGGQDELVFDGASFVMNAAGNVCQQLPAFEEAQALVELRDGAPVHGAIAAPMSAEQTVYTALTLGVRDYVGKNGFPGVLLGLSGGIDSALTLTVAVDALGPERVHAVMMPSQFNAPMSLADSETMVANLGVRASVLPIKPVYDSFLNSLRGEFRDRAFDTTEENIQARIRGTLLMALSNKFGAIVLTTGNKSEMAVGYCTLYGDMAGGFAVLKDIFKTLVYRFASYRNSVSDSDSRACDHPRAQRRVATGSNRSGQLAAVRSFGCYRSVATWNKTTAPEQIIAQGFAEDDVKRMVRLIKINEYKRRQSPVGVRITARGFGKDWRYPITSKYSG